MLIIVNTLIFSSTIACTLAMPLNFVFLLRAKQERVVCCSEERITRVNVNSQQLLLAAGSIVQDQVTKATKIAESLSCVIHVGLQHRLIFLN